MALTRLRVDHAGPLVTIQDAGRMAMQRYGVTRSGPMDRFAFAAANLALHNAVNSSAIEVSVSGLSLRCVSGAIGFAIAGGGFDNRLDAQPLAAWTTAILRTGQCLRIRPGLWGNWCYIAFAGEMVCDHWLGSASTHGALGLGGGALAAGQTLEFTDVRPLAQAFGDIPFPRLARPRRDCRVVRGPQDRFFDEATLARLSTEAFTLSDAYDRMGVRLGGALLTPASELSMPSEPIARGSIQVSGDGVPTVLLADHQTTGGYPKIATILDCDIDRFAQLRSRQTVRFTEVSPAQAVSIARTSARMHEQALALMIQTPASVAPD